MELCRSDLLKANSAFHLLYSLEQTFTYSVLTTLNESQICVDKGWISNQQNQFNKLVQEIQERIPTNRISSSESLESSILHYMSSKGLYVTKDMEQLDILSVIDPVYHVMKELLKAQQFQKQWVTKLTPYYSHSNNRFELKGHWRSFTSYTGRVTASKLPLTSMPNKMKKWMVPFNPTSYLWSIDISNAELRFLALYSGDQQLTADLNEGQDIHWIIGNIIQKHLEYQDSEPNHRKAAKSFIFAMLYGAGDLRLLKVLKKHGYCVGIQHIDEIKSLIFRRYTLLESYFKKVEIEPTVNCFFGSLFPMIDMTASQKRNFALQSSIATAIKFLALIATDNGLKIVNLIHDEIIVEIPFSQDSSWQSDVQNQFIHLLKQFHSSLPTNGVIKIKKIGGKNNEKEV